MIHVMKFIRYFTVMMVFLHVSCALGSSESGMFPRFKGLGTSSSGNVSEVSHVIPSAVFSRLLNCFKKIDIAPYARLVMRSAIKNPDISMGIVLIVAVLGYYGSALISENRRQGIKDKFFHYFDKLINGCSAIMPSPLLNIWSFTRNVLLLPLATFTRSWIPLSNKYVISSLGSIAIGRCTGWHNSGMGLAMFLCFVGLNQEGFDRLAGKIEEVKNEVGKVREDIKNLSNDLTKKIDGVGSKVEGLGINLTDQIKNVSTQISSLETGLQKLGTQNQQLTEQLKIQIDEVKQSFTETLESNIKSWADKLMQKIAVTEDSREKDSIDFNYKLEGIEEDLADLVKVIKMLNNSSFERNEQILNKLRSGEEAVEDVKQLLLQKIEEGFSVVKDESEKLAKGQQYLQFSVDNIQKQQNSFVNLLNKLQDSNIYQQETIDSLSKLIGDNQQALNKNFERLETTSQVQITIINEKLNKIYAEVAANKKEIIENIDVLGNKISKLDLGIQLIDTKIEKTLSESIVKIQNECKSLDDSINRYTEKNLQDKEELSLKMAKVYSDIDKKLSSLVELNFRVASLENDNKEFFKLLEKYQKENKEHQEENKKLSELLSKKIEEQSKETNEKLNKISSQVEQVAKQGDGRLNQIESTMKTNQEKLLDAVLGQRLGDSRENQKNKLELQVY